MGGTATIARADSETIQAKGIGRGRYGDKRERVEAKAIQITGIPRGPYVDNRQSGSRGYTDNGDPRGRHGGNRERAEAREKGGERGRGGEEELEKVDEYKEEERKKADRQNQKT